MKKISKPRDAQKNANDFEDIFYILKTQEKANNLLEFIDFIKENTFGTRNFDIEDIGSKKFRDRKPDWFDAIKSEFSKGRDLEAIRIRLEALEESIREAEIVKIEIAFKPSEDFINKAYDLIKSSKRFKKSGSFLICIEINEQLQGGARFSVSGDYIDVTLKNTVLNFLETNDAINRYL